MSNAFYTKYKSALEQELLDNPVKLVCVDAADYNLVIGTDQYLSAIPAGARVKVSDALTGKTVVDGVFDANDITLSAVSGDQFEYIVLFIDTGNEATSKLIYVIDTMTGLPCTPAGNDIIITWSNGAGKIFSIA